MRRCLTCEREFAGPTWICPACGFNPSHGPDYLSFVNARSEVDGFVPSAFTWLAAAEEGFWWFEARNEIIEWAMAKWQPSAATFLEIGCGTGFVASRIAKRFPRVAISAAEFFPEGLSFVRDRLPSAEMYQIDARHMPFSKEFDVVGAFDVIEHIDEDERVLSEMRRALKANGVALITVPQHPFLWSRVDTFGQHKRRYTRRELSHKLETAGFELLTMRAFVSVLFPLLLIARLAPSSKAYDVEAEFRVSPLLNTLLRAIMRAEFAAIRAGASFPVGGSLLAVARVR